MTPTRDPAKLREQAKLCRSLAVGRGGRRANLYLERLADTWEEQAREIEQRIARSKPRPGEVA
jgi:hypothetical protein